MLKVPMAGLLDNVAQHSLPKIEALAKLSTCKPASSEKNQPRRCCEKLQTTNVCDTDVHDTPPDGL